MNIAKEVLKLNLPIGQYIVVGSGPLAIRGIRETSDVDIVVSEGLFNTYRKNGWEQIPWTYPGKEGKIFLRRANIELYLDVNCGDFNPTLEELLSRADFFEGVPFVSLEDTIKFKIAYNKPKHLKDVELIKKYIL